MDLVKHLLSEADLRPEDEMEQASRAAVAPEETEIQELANLWITGNKGEVAHRFMEMDNETAVKVVFAIGRESAIELARMVDQMIKQTGSAGDSTEPERVEEPESMLSSTLKSHEIE